MRIGIGTSKGSPINVHLLFSPDEANHVSLIEKFISSLEFKLNKEAYRCSRDDLISLGKAHNPGIKDEVAALREGTNQFKVDFNQLRAFVCVSGTLRKNSMWNIVPPRLRFVRKNRARSAKPDILVTPVRNS